MLSNMNVILLWEWMLWSSDAVEDERHYGYPGHRMQSNMNNIMVGAWMLWSSDAVEHERYYGLGMDALVMGCSQTRTLLWLGMDALVIRCS